MVPGAERSTSAHVVVRQLVARGVAEPFSRAHVVLVARRFGVAERTVWRWLSDVRGASEPSTRRPFTVDQRFLQRLAFWRGNVSALHREMVAAAAAGGPAPPSLRTLYRAVRSTAIALPIRAGGARPEPPDGGRSAGAASRALTRRRQRRAAAVRAVPVRRQLPVRCMSHPDHHADAFDIASSDGGPERTLLAARDGQGLISTVHSVRVATPDPRCASSIDGLIEHLRLLKVWAGDPSYAKIRDAVNDLWSKAGRPAAEQAGKTTVVDCFRPGRRRLNVDLVLAIVQILNPDDDYVAQWRSALRIVGGEVVAASQVRVHDQLPRDVTEFTGRLDELDQLHRVVRDRVHGSATAVMCAIEGMPGVGKTHLVVHAAHLLVHEGRFDRVLFVNLRGFDEDLAQPPADPAAVLEALLRLLGVPAHKVPYDIAARTRLYRRALTGTRTLVVLDNAADSAQVRPLLPGTSGSLTLVNSRRNLTELHPSVRLVLDVFTSDEGRQLIACVTPRIPDGDDPEAVGRISELCGFLPLALRLVAEHVRARPGWTLTDAADWLDECRDDRRVPSGVELAFNLSYHHLSADLQGLLRRLALHPGVDMDAYAAAALADIGVGQAETALDQLCGEHLLRSGTCGRYEFHDLVRAYAMNRARDQDRGPERRAAFGRLVDYYLAVASTAVNIVYPGDRHHRAPSPPALTPTPELNGAREALLWLDGERLTLLSVAAHTAREGWPGHTVRLSQTLFRYLDGGYCADAIALHGHAQLAAGNSGDPVGQAHALTNLGVAYWRAGQPELATLRCEEAAELFRRAGDTDGRIRTLTNLGILAVQSGHYQTASAHYAQALALNRRAGHQAAEARSLINVGSVERRLGREADAAALYQQALALFRQVGDRLGEATALTYLGGAETRLGKTRLAGNHLRLAVAIYRHLGNHSGQASALDSLGLLHTSLGRPDKGTEYHAHALLIVRESGYRHGEAWALNGLGEAAHTAGRHADAVTHHRAALAVAEDTEDREQQARAARGLGQAYRSLGDMPTAVEHLRRSLVLYTALGLAEADTVRVDLNTAAAQR